MNPIKTITTYVRSSIAELKKVTWPNKETTVRYSILVIVVSLAVAAFFATLDFGFSRVITFVLSQGQRSPAPAVEEPVTPEVVPTDIDVGTVGEEGGDFTVGEGEPEDVELQPSFTDIEEDIEFPSIE